MEYPRPNQLVCSIGCAKEYSKRQSEKKRKVKIKELKESTKTKSEHLKELQVIFNTYIRTRDKGKPCISCGTTINGTAHASHFLSVGSHPSLRFNEDNVHSSCEHCNLHLHGNQFEYSQRLPSRIGQTRFDELIGSRGERQQLSIPEIEELKIHYRLKIRQLK